MAFSSGCVLRCDLVLCWPLQHISFTAGGWPCSTKVDVPAGRIYQDLCLMTATISEEISPDYTQVVP